MALRLNLGLQFCLAVTGLAIGIGAGCATDPDEDACTAGSLGCECAQGACESGLACTTQNICLPFGGDGDGDGDGDDNGDGDGDPLPPNKDVDILFVIDNSGSMGEEQALLADNIGSFIDILEADDMSYRIGITTTDAGNDWCSPSATTPERGRLVASSCTGRLGDFLFDDGTIDAQDVACNNVCTLAGDWDVPGSPLEILPTTTEFDVNPSVRPWLENIAGVKNIPADTAMSDAFACYAPQGINGCGFESPLESMYLALTRAQTQPIPNFPEQDEPSYGFMRQEASLALVIITDEVDCSENKSWSEIFSAQGNKVFWSDPESAFPTSAVCWNAGVECVGDPSGYDSCEPSNKDVDGNLDVSDFDAVLLPMARYIDKLAGVQDEKQVYNPSARVTVALIAGVGLDGQVVYRDVSDTDPGFQDSYGIGPGCEGDSIDGVPMQAVPPVRLRALTEEFTPGNMFSICASDYTPALEAIAAKITD